MLKKIFLLLAVLAVFAAAVIFVYRSQILRYSASAIIRNYLPCYVKIDRIDFRPSESRLVLNGFKVLNPPGFQAKDILEIDEIICAYKMKGKNITSGIQALEPVFKKAVLNIERLENGQVNLLKMQNFINESRAAPVKEAPGSGNQKSAGSLGGLAGNRKISEIITLPTTFSLNNSRIIFIDRFKMPKSNIITFDNISSTVTMRLDDAYSKMLSLTSVGEGYFNGKAGERIRWDISLDPTKPRLTMSNRFDVSDIDILALEPYYDRYSPLVFDKGRFSGTLVFDFDNGNIGSSNEIHLSGYGFYVKKGYENAQFWDTTVPDLVKYFTSPYGEIVFDFKIKGDMADPKFYLGPISKAALANMAIDKISAAIQKAAGPQGDGSTGAPKTKMSEAGQYINLFRELVKKK